MYFRAGYNDGILFSFFSHAYYSLLYTVNFIQFDKCLEWGLMADV